jgi:Zn-dependent protease
MFESLSSQTYRNGISMVPMFGNSFDVAIIILILVLSSSFHEAAHAWAAYRCGDDTAKNFGRISLNPLAHLCPVNSVILPAITYTVSYGSFVFGGARPVPIIPEKLENPDRDMAFTAAAGPIANIILVILSSILLILGKPIFSPLINIILCNFILINLLLTFFNLIPIPPLDGSRIFRYLFPQVRDLYDSMDQWGIAFLMMLIFFFPGFLQIIHIGIKTALVLINYAYRSVPW